MGRIILKDGRGCLKLFLLSNAILWSFHNRIVESCMAILLDGESWYKRKTVVDRALSLSSNHSGSHTRSTTGQPMIWSRTVNGRPSPKSCESGGLSYRQTSASPISGSILQWPLRKTLITHVWLYCCAGALSLRNSYLLHATPPARNCKIGGSSLLHSARTREVRFHSISVRSRRLVASVGSMSPSHAPLSCSCWMQQRRKWRHARPPGRFQGFSQTIHRVLRGLGLSVHRLGLEAFCRRRSSGRFEHVSSKPIEDHLWESSHSISSREILSTECFET